MTMLSTRQIKESMVLQNLFENLNVKKTKTAKIVILVSVVFYD